MENINESDERVEKLRLEVQEWTNEELIGFDIRDVKIECYFPDEEPGMVVKKEVVVVHLKMSSEQAAGFRVSGESNGNNKFFIKKAEMNTGAEDYLNNMVSIKLELQKDE